MRLPAGVRDWLPHELARKREIEQQLRAVFGRWAYEEVQTPIIERFDVLERGLGEETTELLFHFNDRRSTALALRPEMTTPVARLVSTRMRDVPLPIRLAYVAPVFRYYEQPQEGRMRELTQAGAELIGAAGIDADAETLFMAIEGLAEIGVADARFDINDARVVDGILDGAGLHGERALEAKEHIKRRNLVALRAFGVPALVEFAHRRGGHDAIAAARSICRTPDSRAALDQLDAMLDRARALGYESRVTVDFALLRDLEYYTGFLFEGYVEEIGMPLCGGGPVRLAAAAIRIRRAGRRLDRRRGAAADRAGASREARAPATASHRRSGCRLGRRGGARARGRQCRALRRCGSRR